MDNDVCRNTANPPPKDTTGLTDTQRFGSQHLSGVNVVLADGSVRTDFLHIVQSGTVFHGQWATFARQPSSQSRDRGESDASIPWFESFS